MPIFDINYDTLVVQLLPVRLRQSVQKAWVTCLIAPVIYLKGLFDTNRATDLYDLAHNGQICYLEAVLNDTFDDTSRRIYITDGPYFDALFLYTTPEEKPLWTGLISEEGSTSYPDPEWLYTSAETYTLGISFIIHVPSSLTFDMARMKALVDRYRLPGKNNYTVVTF
jgi:hypothetical protein